MLLDYIFGVLPATEDYIIKHNPLIQRDYLLKRIRNLELTGQIRNCRGVFYEIRGRFHPDGFHPEGEVEEGEKQTHGGLKVKGQSERTRTCRKCGTTYKGILDNFNTQKSSVCKKCATGVMKRSKTKTCSACGKEYTGLKRHFRQNRRTQAWHDICKACEDKQ